MRVVSRPAVLALLVLLLAPGRAQADWMGFWDFLDNLSGPGPFNGYGFGTALRCKEGPEWTWCDWERVKEGDLVPFRRLGGRREVEISPFFSYMYGQTNDDLPYPAGTLDSQKSVDVATVGAELVYWFVPRIGLKVKGAAYHFKGPLVRGGDGLTRLVYGLGPVFRPIDVGKWYLDVTPFWHVGLGQFQNADFGLDPAATMIPADNVKFGMSLAVGF